MVIVMTIGCPVAVGRGLMSSFPFYDSPGRRTVLRLCGWAPTSPLIDGAVMMTGPVPPPQPPAQQLAGAAQQPLLPASQLSVSTPSVSQRDPPLDAVLSGVEPERAAALALFHLDLRTAAAGNEQREFINRI